MPTKPKRLRRAAAGACTFALLLATTALAATTHADRSVRPPSQKTRIAAMTTVAAFQKEIGLIDPAAAAQLRAMAEALPRRARASRLARAIARMVSAGDRIAHLPYVYGGGHGSFSAAGYDCSGSVSYVLHAAGLLGVPEDSSGLEGYGAPGPGRHVTIYANAGHALMTIDGRRYDTIAFQETGTRWADSVGDVSGYVVRHPPGM